MVALNLIESSNARLPSRLVAVFVGGTSGIGEYTLKSFAKHCSHPRAYIIGRSQSAGTRITSELTTLNPTGTYHFIKSDIGEIKNVDDVCAEIKEKETRINILFLTQGTMINGVETDEGLHLVASLIMHSRTRFIVNLLPLIQRAAGLRRVVQVFAGTKEGPIDNPDLQMRSLGNPLKVRGQAASCVTLALQHVAEQAPEVSFLHGFPGPVRSNIARGGGVLNFVMRSVFKVVGPFVYIPDEESGDRHLYLATSARYPSQTGVASGVEMESGVTVARGVDGKPGSGLYAVDEKCESADPKVEELLVQLKKEGKDRMVWGHIQEDFIRITGKESIWT